MFGLIPANVRKISFQPLHRRNLARENPIQNQTNLLPVKFVSSYREFGFRPEEMIKTSLFHTGLLTNLIDAHRPIALPPDELMSSLQEA